MPVRSFHFRVVRILRRQLFEAEKSLVRQADVITAASRACAEDLKGYHGIDKEITVIGNGIDPRFFVPNETNEMDETYILYTGRLETIKGLVSLVESAKYVCQKYKNLKYVLVGKGTIEKVLRNRVSELGLDRNFHFAGQISDRNRLLQYYQKASIFVLPSLYEGGWPYSLLEAMSCGAASIATDVGGNREVMADGETGLLVPSRDSKALAGAILKLLDNKELRHRIGANARKRITNSYDWKLVVDRVEAIYSTID
jgi:glycosyltransferase involved in cell wall biosynthesis